MHCPQCLALTNDPQAVFCPRCGSRLPSAVPVSRLAPIGRTPPRTRPMTDVERVASLDALKTRLLAEYEAKHQALIADGSILAVPSVQWLGNQTAVCAQGHRASYRAFANMTRVRQDTHLGRIGPYTRFSAGFQCCPTCCTDVYTFDADSLKDYVVCAVFEESYGTTSYHLYRKGLGECPTCRIRDEYRVAIGMMI